VSDYLTIDALDVGGRTVLVRADLNVPLDAGSVVDDYRIIQSLPTITALRDRGARVLVCSHLGRPKGIDPSLSMAPVAARLGRLGGFDVVTATDVAGDGARAAVAQASADTVVVLENTRFAPGETKNDPGLSDDLAALADLFVLDAFGSAHRAHASTVGVAERLRSAAGGLMDAEVTAFQRLLQHPERPYVVVLGGAKVSDKLGVMEALLPKVDALLVGGAMCFTLLAAEGYDIGTSRVEPDMMDEVRRVLDGPYGGRVTLPVDIVVADEFASDAAHAVVKATDMPSDRMGLDIGPETVARFGAIIEGADTVFWNGPMGVFEWEAFAGGTKGVAEAVGRSTAYTVAGGGDSVAALRQFGLDGAVSHLSTGGGAGLELLEQGSLPGLDVLRRWA
jgi:phosphoglycerate kinase